MSQRSVIIYSAGRIDEAMLVKQLLEERGIESFIENQVLQGAVGELPPGEATNPRVRVDEDDAEKAREVVKGFEHQQRLARQRSPEVETHFVEDWTDWPTCPQCGRRRQTVCPICETAGTDLPLADPNHVGVAPTLGPQKNEADSNRPLLICTTCDEPFPPQFYQVCQWCGYEYEEGLPAPQTSGSHEQLSPRMWAVLAAVAALLAGLCGYFWWITRG